MNWRIDVKKDLIFDEVRQFRDAYAARFNHDVKAIFADLRRRQKKSGHRQVSPTLPQKKRP